MTGGPEILRFPAGRVAWREVDGRVVALDTGESVYLGANRAASTLWPRLEGGATHDDLARALVAEHGIALDRARRDVAAFVRALDARGLIERIAAAS